MLEYLSTSHKYIDEKICITNIRAGPEISGALGDIRKDFIEKNFFKKLGVFLKNLRVYVYVVFFKKIGGLKRMFHPALPGTGPDQ